jgi:hypothetical protein
MKELTLAVRHENHLTFAEFDAIGNIARWKIGIDVKHLNGAFDDDLPFTTVLIVGKEEVDGIVKCSIFDTFDLKEEVGSEATNIINAPGFSYYAGEILSMYMQENGYIKEDTEILH